MAMGLTLLCWPSGRTDRDLGIRLAVAARLAVGALAGLLGRGRRLSRLDGLGVVVAVRRGAGERRRGALALGRVRGIGVAFWRWFWWVMDFGLVWWCWMGKWRCCGW